MILFTEGFDWTTTVGDLLSYSKWFDSNTTGATLGNTSGNLRFGSGSGNYYTTSGRNSYIQKAFGSNLASGVVGFAFRANTSANYKLNLVTLYDTASTVQIGVLLNTDGTLSIFRNTHATILGTSAFAITGNQWTYFELKFLISDSITSGDVVLYADGVAILTLATAVDTKQTANAYATHFSFNGGTPSITSASSTTTFYDDVYASDGDLLGSVRIQTLFPSGNGNTSEFLGSDGNMVNNYQQVDDTALNIADYNDGVTVGDKDTYAFTDTVLTTSIIYAVSINHVSLRTDSDPRSVTPIIRHSGTDYAGASQALGSSAATFQQIHDENPGTTAAWTKSEVDAAEFGLEVDA